MPPSLIPYPPRPCALCGEEFSPGRKDGRFCSSQCSKIFQGRANHHKNRDQRNAERKARYHANPEPAKEKSREWHRTHREESLQYYRERYLLNKDKHIARSMAYHASHPEKVREWTIAAKKRRPWVSLIAHARTRARKKGLDFDLTTEWAESVWTGNCTVSGIAFVVGEEPYSLRAPSIDRIDSALGYVQSNCRFILHAVNAMKGTGSDEDMYRIAESLLRNRQNAAPPKPVITAFADGFEVII